MLNILLLSFTCIITSLSINTWNQFQQANNFEYLNQLNASIQEDTQEVLRISQQMIYLSSLYSKFAKPETQESLKKNI